MKKKLLLSSLAVFTVGAFALILAQDDAASDTLAPEAEVAQSTTSEPKTAAAVVPNFRTGIRTDVVTFRKLPGTSEAVTTAPVSSVFVDEGKFFVLAKGAESDVDFREVEVTLGKTDGSVVEITGGLTPGDEVVTISVMQLPFPAFDDPKQNACATTDASCEGASCGTSCATHSAAACGQKGCAASGSKSCEKAGGKACDLSGDFGVSMPAAEFFNGAFEMEYGSAVIDGPQFFPPF